MQVSAKGNGTTAVVKPLYIFPRRLKILSQSETSKTGENQEVARQQPVEIICPDYEMLLGYFLMWNFRTGKDFRNHNSGLNTIDIYVLHISYHFLNI